MSSVMTPREKFLAEFPSLVDELTSILVNYGMPNDAIKWYQSSLEHNTPGGKLNRGLSVIDTYAILKGKNNIDSLSHEEYRKLAILGWCIELLQAYFLVADDMMDQSITRRGQPCWYRMPDRKRVG